MEEFFVILGIAVFWLLRGSAAVRKRGASREEIDREPFSESDGAGSVLEASIQAIEDRAEHRAAEALRRWEARRETRDEQVEPPPLHLREALRSIAANLPIDEPAVEPQRLPVPVVERDARRTRETPVETVRAKRMTPAARPRPRDQARSAGAALRRLERLPPLHRAIVFADIFGLPMALRDRPPGSGAGE